MEPLHEDTPKERDEKAEDLVVERDEKAEGLRVERNERAAVLAEDRLIRAEDLRREMRVQRIQMWLGHAGLFALIIFTR